ncbi:hypothetical protein E2C01_011380 [Portunus trituberculatus]|uniref:Uncharacterized protein n=1 Tax=Portunus trituberculatus TaxID=210409 RepID=A0A5B7DBJ2_PORTR|nr:hypothetical protein [Portunus trituberculatus]
MVHLSCQHLSLPSRFHIRHLSPFIQFNTTQFSTSSLFNLFKSVSRFSVHHHSTSSPTPLDPHLNTMYPHSTPHTTYPPLNNIHLLSTPFIPTKHYGYVRSGRSTQSALGVGWLTLHPGDLPRWPVAQPQTARNNVMPPNHDALAPIGVCTLADKLVVLNGNTVWSLCIPAAAERVERGGTDSIDVACQGQRASITTRR